MTRQRLNGNCTSAHFEALCTYIPQKSQIKYLEINDCSDDNLAQLCQLILNYKQLESLTLRWQESCSVANIELLLSAVESSQTLKKLDISCNILLGVDAALQRMIANNKSLIECNLSWIQTGYSSDSFHQTIQLAIKSNSTLHTLLVSGEGMYLEKVQAYFLALKDHPSIRSFTAMGDSCKLIASQPLLTMISDSVLKNIYLSFNSYLMLDTLAEISAELCRKQLRVPAIGVKEYAQIRWSLEAMESRRLANTPENERKAIIEDLTQHYKDKFLLAIDPDKRVVPTLFMLTMSTLLADSKLDGARFDKSPIFQAIKVMSILRKCHEHKILSLLSLPKATDISADKFPAYRVNHSDYDPTIFYVGKYSKNTENRVVSLQVYPFFVERNGQLSSLHDGIKGQSVSHILEC